ncbi:MAG: effector binding domain-containing protein [Alkalibacterium sp.]|nr:effector binding domain-containing protein [Alkalibacterium sp.]
MEDHLMEEISYSDVAKHLYLSNYHFQRVFSLITGVTPNEYIRSRRLSMAGEELTLSQAKIIDVAYKYGYESPESFSKAFTRFHGVSPGKAKKAGIELNSYNRLVMKLSTEGGTIMNYRIVERDPFKLIAKVEQFPNESIDESSEVENKIPDFWEKSGKTDVFETLREHALTGDLYGVCAPISKESDYFDYGIGMLHDGSEVPEGYRIWNVKPTLWAAFPCIGDDPVCIGETWERIFKEFLPGSNYHMLDDTDFELYPAEKDDKLFCEIWIPVEKINL